MSNDQEVATQKVATELHRPIPVVMDDELLGVVYNGMKVYCTDTIVKEGMITLINPRISVICESTISKRNGFYIYQNIVDILILI